MSLVAIFIAPSLASAARDIPLQVGILSQDKVQNLAQYVGLVYQYLVGIAGIFAVAMIMYAGMKWIFAGGDASKISAAKETINHAMIGLILALASYLILNTINPGLVSLQVPEVRTLTGVQLAQGWCPNEDQFAGRYRCGQRVTNPPPESGITGSCVGASCDVGGCFQVGGVYQCADPSVCPTSCDGINRLAIVTSDELLRVYCASEICKDQISTGCRVQSWTIARGEQPSGFPSHPATKCIDRLREGQYQCERNEDCAYDRGNIILKCNFGEAPNTCRPAAGLSAGIACDKDHHCESGICNKGYATDKCAPSGGSLVNEPCIRDRDCGAPSSERVCNMYLPSNLFREQKGTCAQVGAVPSGQPCNPEQPNVCVSGVCERGSGTALVLGGGPRGRCR